MQYYSLTNSFFLKSYHQQLLRQLQMITLQMFEKGGRALHISVDDQMFKLGWCHHTWFNYDTTKWLPLASWRDSISIPLNGSLLQVDIMTWYNTTKWLPIASWRNIGETLVKYWWNTGKTLAKHWQDTGETLAKCWWNTGDTLVKHLWNNSKTLVKH